MNKPGLLLIGAGGHARSCIDVIEGHGQYQVAGLIGLPDDVGTQHLGYAVVGTDGNLPKFIKTYQYALITVGQIRAAAHRIRLYQRVLQLGFQYPVITAPNSLVSRYATIGAGSIVMHGAIVNAGARVGNNCIINSRALIEHDVTVEDHCHISTGAILNGEVTVGSGSLIGSGSVIKQGITIGKNCLVGMGLTVRYNLSDGCRFTGH